ncbi:hypothetical protein [Candidatus Endoriftia persephone]|nr:hypothetical protein [Candidatus Endoriftia persephone]EGV50276.1 hypothetical protein Rifp1Sym_dn00030 [endosymbiont of Riftia pachyptila (vent Ph05)]USF87687.1 2-oxoglutarate synthase [Candidatus Endoriftia persephone]
MNKRKVIVGFRLLVVGLLATFEAMAEPNTIEVRLAAFWASTATELRLDSKDGTIGTSFNMEDQLGLGEREILPMLDITYRFNENHAIDLSYVELSRSGSSMLNSTITIDGEDYTVDTLVDSFFDSKVARLAWRYKLYQNEDWQIESLLGVHVTSLSTGISTRLAGPSYDADVSIPLPSLGLDGAYWISPKLKLDAWAQVFALDYDAYSGSLVNGSISVRYDFSKNFGIGGGYTYYGYSLSADDDNLRGEFDYTFQGPMLYLQAGY